MSIDYSSSTGFGFVVDEASVRVEHDEAYEHDGMWGVMEEVLQDYPLLTYSDGSPYDSWKSTFAIEVKRLYQSHTRYDDAFGVFVLGQETPTNAEEYQLNRAYEKYGTGPIGPLAVFNCS